MSETLSLREQLAVEVGHAFPSIDLSERYGPLTMAPEECWHLANRETYQRFCQHLERIVGFWRPGDELPSHQTWFISNVRACPPGTRILDVGCHDGELLLTLRHFDRGWDLHGVEVVPQRVLYCLANELPVICGFAENLPHEDESFDVVCLGEILEHLADPGVAVDEALRVLKPGGMLLITVPFGPWGLGSPEGTPCHVRDIAADAFTEYGAFYYTCRMGSTFPWSAGETVGSHCIRLHKRVP